MEDDGTEECANSNELKVSLTAPPNGEPAQLEDDKIKSQLGNSQQLETVDENSHQLDSKDEILTTTPENKSESSQILEAESPSDEDFTIFHCVSYLGASTIKEPRNEAEIHQVMNFLNENTVDGVIQVSVSVPLYSDGNVIVYEEENQLEISRFLISQIIFFARGKEDSSDSSCFAFSCAHGDETSFFQCHVFKCTVPEAVSRVFSTFAKTFSAPPSTLRLNGTNTRGRDEESSEKKNVTVVFQVTLEVKEDDGKGNYSGAVREKGYFKLRSSTPKLLSLTISQLPSPLSPLLTIDRCFGLLLSPGRRVRNSDLELVEMLSWSIGSTSPPSYNVTGSWDTNDPAFEPLNRATEREGGVFFTVALDLVIKGIQEPIRFAVETQCKVYPPSERFWSLSRPKSHFTTQFLLTLAPKSSNEINNSEIKYDVISNTPLGEVKKAKENISLNFTSFVRGLTPPEGREEEEEDDDDEPLQSGMGEISKDCTDEQLAAWSTLVSNWNHSPLAPRPKNLENLVKNGIPDALRGEIWSRLGGVEGDGGMMESYKHLLALQCPNEDVIQRDISRTFPANDYFKEPDGAGQELLYRISKAYAVYDTEVGYCQGISFIAAALLLQMPEEQAFCLLVKIMYDYEFRQLYRHGFDNLRLKLYQLDRLIEDQIPELFSHFRELGIESHMYANQWFLTLYTAKFPLVFVFRVIDSFLLGGTKIIFQLALSLLSGARKELLMLDFEGILKYFRVSLPKKYRTPEAVSLLFRSAHGAKVKKLKKYEEEYVAAKEQEKNQMDPLERLEKENKRLMEDLLRSEHLITNLVLSKLEKEEQAQGLETELHKTKISLKEMTDFNQRIKEETNSVKDLFQREVRQYDEQDVKKSNIIAEYKKICSTLSSQVEEKERALVERTHFFRSNLCEPCSAFISTALQLAANKPENSTTSNSLSPNSTLNNESDSSSSNCILLEKQGLETELAKTKMELAECRCENEELNHELKMTLSELKSNSGRLFKNFNFLKEKRSSLNLEDSGNSRSISSSLSLQNFSLKK